MNNKWVQYLLDEQRTWLQKLLVFSSEKDSVLDKVQHILEEDCYDEDDRVFLNILRIRYYKGK